MKQVDDEEDDADLEQDGEGDLESGHAAHSGTVAIVEKPALRLRDGGAMFWVGFAVGVVATVLAELIFLAAVHRAIRSP